MWNQSFLELFERGGGVMWPLLAFSVVGFAIAVERVLVFLYRDTSYRRFAREVREPLLDGKISEVKTWLASQRTPLARVVETYLQNLKRSAKLREEAVGREASEQIANLERRLSWLSIIGHLSPILGLLGTVAGLIEAFHQIELQGGQVQPSDLAAGIWAALLTTVFGLTIALPVLGVYHILENRAGAMALKMQWIVARLNDWLDQEPTGLLPGGVSPPADPLDRMAEDIGIAANE